MAETIHQDWIRELREEGLRAVEKLYAQWREEFLAFASRYGGSQDDVLDAYQDALIILYENVRKGKLTELSSSPKTYLFSIGKYTLLNSLKRQGKQRTLVSEAVEQEVSWTPPDDELNDRQQRLMVALKGLGKSCQELIDLFYYQRLSIREIVAKTGLKNENTVKAQKSRCVKSLRANMQKV